MSSICINEHYLRAADSGSFLKKLILRILFLSVLLTPIYSLMETSALMAGELPNLSTSITPFYIKGIKDILAFIVVFLSILLIFIRNKIYVHSVVGLLFFLLISIYSIIYSLNDPLTFMVGIRWCFPFILIIALIGTVRNDFLFNFANLMFYLLIIHLCFQIVQFFFISSFFGVNALGLSARSPGMFIVPNTGAFFSVLVLFFALFYMRNGWKRYFLITTTPLSVLLTASGTGVLVVMLLLLVNWLHKKGLRVLFFILMPFLSIFIVSILEFMTGRVGIVRNSFGDRSAQFYELLSSADWFSQMFGYGTSTSTLIANEFGVDLHTVAIDSLFTTLLVNLGLFPLIAFVLFLIVFILISLFLKRNDIFSLLIIYISFGLTTIVNESFPNNLIISILLSVYIPICFQFKFKHKLGLRETAPSVSI